MKKITLLFGILLVFASCQNENLNDSNIQSSDRLSAEEELALEDEILTSDLEEDDLELTADSEVLVSSSLFLKSGGSKDSAPRLIKKCDVIDADRSCNGQNAANFWWPVNPTDYNDYYFSSSDDHKLTFSEYDNGTANIKGSTLRGTCVVEVDVWLKNKKDYASWVSEDGGTVKPEGCNVDTLVKEDLFFYVIDSSRSTITASGNCLEGNGEGAIDRAGTYGVEQRPDPNDLDTPNLGVILGPGGALWETDGSAFGLATWGWLTDKNTGERLHIFDFNFTLDCTEKCSDCEGKVTELELKYDWHRKKRVKIYQKKENTCYGVKIFDKVLEPGETFSISGANNDGTFGKNIYMFLGSKRCSYYTKIRTDCKIKIGPGYFRGVFEVVRGESSEGGELCEYEKDYYNKCKRYWWGSRH